ncbi:hypothetical protein, partial [Heliomarina baculiformis]|uniref:hypothetical protein n=1 Tax=Heliomarina baculiformis TaxID=2872036 RepID=UPI001EE316D8
LRSRPSPSVPPVWRPVSASAPPVKGYLRMTPDIRKGFFEKDIIFFSKKHNIACYQILDSGNF